MADDQIWNYAEGFIEGRISRRAFWELENLIIQRINLYSLPKKP